MTRDRCLEGKAVIVTGAARGLGRAFALRAAVQGASVVVNDVDAAALVTLAGEIRDAGGQAEPITGSVGRWETGTALVEAALGRFGSLDGLINNAAIHHLALPWEEEAERIRRMIEVNVLGTFYCGVQALRQMVAQGRGAILNITSGAHIGMELLSTYGASKGAVASLTYGWAVDAEAAGVRVNALSPIAETAMAQDSDVALAQHGRSASGTARPGPEAIAPIATFLLSDLAAGITGQIVRCTGERVSLMRPPAAADPFIAAVRWSEGELAAAFDATLRQHLAPVGFRRTPAAPAAIVEEGTR